MSETEELVEKLRAWAGTEQERAALEARLWLAAPRMEVRINPGNYIAQLTGCSIYSAEARRALWLVGPVAQPLWHRILGGMTLNAAQKILARAKANPGGIPAEIEAYDKLGFERVLANGKRVRSPRPKARNVRSWEKIRASVFEHARLELGEVGEADAERLARQLDVELREVLRDHHKRVARFKASHAGGVALVVQLPAAELRAACRELGVKVPAPGQPVDLDAARKRKRELVKRYHPDVTGDEASRPAYEAVIQAFAALERYDESLTTRGDQDESQGRSGGEEVAGS